MERRYRPRPKPSAFLASLAAEDESADDGWTSLARRLTSPVAEYGYAIEIRLHPACADTSRVALADALRAAYRRGAEDMRRRADHLVDCRADATVDEDAAAVLYSIADAIGALPVEPPEGA